MIKNLRPEFTVHSLCSAFEVSPSGYYAWLKKPDSPRQKQEERQLVEIKAAHKRTRGTYGPERLQEDLAKHGVYIGVYKIKKIRKKHGIRCIQKKKYKATTNSKHNLPVADNLLDQEFDCKQPNTAWVTDITYIPTDEGWLYLAGHQDLFNGEIVGYAMSDRMTKNLVSESLIRSVLNKRPAKGLIHHSDRGSQYCSLKYSNLLKKYKMKSSMSRKGNCYDNAPIESFWGTLKTELVNHRQYKTRREAINDITEYIEIFYNRQRIQKKLGYLSPVAFEQKLFKEQLAA